MTSSVQERFKETAGYLGETSFKATIQQDDEEEQNGEGDVEMVTEDLEEPSPVDAAERLMMLQILESIPDEKTCGVLMKFYNAHTVGTGMSKLTLAFILDAFWEVFRGLMGKRRTAQGLERVAEIIDGNGQSAMEEPDNAREWHESFSVSDREISLLLSHKFGGFRLRYRQNSKAHSEQKLLV